MEENNRNLFMVVILSVFVMAAWQYFVVSPQEKLEAARRAAITHEERKPAATSLPGVPGVAPSGHLTRLDALKLGGKRIAIDTPTVDGSLMLKGARFDDLRLKKYRETVDPKSPEIVLLSPESTLFPYYAVFGWVAAPGANLHVPDDATPWNLVHGSKLAPGSSVTLQWDNGQGLVFTRTISVDSRYMFAVDDAVANKGHAKVTLF